MIAQNPVGVHYNTLNVFVPSHEVQSLDFHLEQKPFQGAFELYPVQDL